MCISGICVSSVTETRWENLQEIRWVIKDTAGVELPDLERKTIDLEGRIVKDGVRKALRERQLALADLVHAIKDYRHLPRTLL